MKQPERISVPDLPKPPFPYAHAVRSNEFVFVSGQSAIDYEAGLDAEASVPDAASYAVRPVKRQLDVVYRRLDRILGEAGTSLDSIARVVNLFTRRKDVDPANEVRHSIGTRPPTSAALEVSSLLAPAALVEIDAIAVVENGARRLEPFDAEIAVNARAAYSKALAFGDTVFLVGATAGDHSPNPTTGTSSVAADARVDRGYWLGSDIKRQARYVVQEKLIPLLNVANCSLNDVIRAQVYLTDIERDLGAFLEEWRELFPAGGPSLQIAPVASLGVIEAVIEISMVAIRNAGSDFIHAQGKQAAGSRYWLGSVPAALAGGGLAWCSTVAAVDADGLTAPARPSRALPYFETQGRRQMRVVLDRLAATLDAVESSIDRVVKLTCWTADLGELPGYIDVWADAFGDAPCAMTVVEVRKSLFAPGCTVCVDAIGLTD